MSGARASIKARAFGLAWPVRHGIDPSLEIARRDQLIVGITQHSEPSVGEPRFSGVQQRLARLKAIKMLGEGDLGW